MANLINLENVTKTFGLKTLLDGVSLASNRGRIGVVDSTAAASRRC